MGVASIIVEMTSQEYNMYLGTIKQKVDAPDRIMFSREALFRKWIFGGWALSTWLILSLKWTLRNIVSILEPLDRAHKPPIESALEGRHRGFSGSGYYGRG